MTGLAYHHGPEESDELMAYATSFSCTVAEMIGTNVPAADVETLVLPSWTGRIGIAPENIVRLCQVTLARYEQLTTDCRKAVGRS